MVNQRADRSQRLAWLEGIRIFAVAMLLLYHAQLRFTGYAYTPQPTGLEDNLRQLFAATEELPLRGVLTQLLSLPSWFGFQFIDVFVLISGFSLVLSLKGKLLQVGSFLQQRFLRLLWPFWTIAWLSYPVLWAIAVATGTNQPNPWYMFVGISFPLVYDSNGQLLIGTSGPWWLMSLILSFAVLFPFLWMLMRRWGAMNLLVVSVLLTVTYRTLAVYVFGGHPTYVVWDSPAGWHPFALFLPKFSTFVIGMAVGQAYLRHQGPIYWDTQRVLTVGIPAYVSGFICQFYLWGWIWADLLLPVGLCLCLMVVFRALASLSWVASLLLAIGGHSYSYFLLHGLVTDRTLELFVQGSSRRYDLSLPLILVGTLILAILVDYTGPLIRRIVLGLLRDVDYVLSIAPTLHRRVWDPQVGDQVCYQGEAGWTVLKVEKLLDEQEFFVYQVSDGQRSLWVNEDDLEPAGKRSR
ncbi:MAG: acyltransferase [Leptolyngbyaceae cyanobacterium RU_5_1]|nr:acyltransferase [Leptolyngbyaceae cyanobacterium RU_5_1]